MSPSSDVPEVSEAPRALGPVVTAPAQRWNSKPWFALENPALTAAYWGTVALQVVAMWLPKFPPFVDYSQHIAVASVLHRCLVPGAPERFLYDVNLFTYNGAFHLAAALLGFAMPMEVAGKVVLSVLPPLMAASALALMRVAARPRSYAFFLLPLTFNCVLTWGFLNNAFGFSVGLLGFAKLFQALEARRNEGKPWLVAGLLGALSAYLHIFGAFAFCLMGGIAALHRAGRMGPSLRERAALVLKTGLTLAPSVLLSGAFVVFNRSSSHSNWENQSIDGLDEVAWKKVIGFAGIVMGNFPDHSDRVLFFVLVAVVACLFLPGIRRTGAPKVMGLLAVFFALLYLVVPRVAFATWFIFERAAYLALAFAVAAAPVPRPSFLRGVRPVAAVLALATAVNIGVHFARVPDERDADAILDHIPEGAKVVGLMYNPAPWPQLERATWVHFQSYHLARHQGETTPSFLFIESLPVHYKPEHRPPRAPAGTEWSPEAYNLDSALAAHFTTVLVRAPWDTPDPTFKVFGAAGADVNILAHEGRFWLYDTKELLRRRGADVDPFE